MEHSLHYGTVSEAVEAFRKQGYTLNFNLGSNCISAGEHNLKAEEFEIVDVYRYEGNTDPADEAVVYAIESGNGLKGVLVMGYGAYADIDADNFLKTLRYRNKK